jgi:transcriptional regulator with XRE-family HTH domain
MDYTTAFGPWLKERRVALDLSGEELAACINYSAATLRNLESGRRRPSRQLAERLAHCLKIPPEEYDSFIAFARGVRCRISSSRRPARICRFRSRRCWDVTPWWRR